MKISRRGFFKRVGAVTALAGIAAFARDFSEPVEIPVGNKKLKVIFNFGWHRKAADAMPLEPILRNFRPHVVCIEEMGFERKQAEQAEENFYSLQPKSGAFSAFSKAQHELLGKYRPKIYFLERFEPRETDEIFDLAGKQVNSQEAAYAALDEGNTDLALRQYREYLQASVKEVVRRESAIKSVLSRLHSSLVKRYPELAKEKEIRVVVRYGGAHTSLYKQARKIGFGGVERKMPTPAYYLPSEAFVRRSAFGLPQDFSDAEVARTITAEALSTYAKRLGTNLENSAAFGNLLGKKTNLGQFRRIFSEGIGKESDRSAVMRTRFQQEGIKLPASTQEVHAFLEKRVGPKRLALD
ncbi:hypothetical protein H0O03_05115 [Candidatus Micrarchaeota archaeon]|nr:hypothetical protein [Candidatus Micrarchaeota archaeon]